MSKDRILAIEDDEGVCRLLRHSLAREDYLVRIAHSGEEGLEEAFRDPPDIFLLDLELPGMDGLSVCQELKNNPATQSLPIIILSGKGEESDVVLGLQMGADDYIVKPFSPKILNARVQAVLRRRPQTGSAPANAEEFAFGPLLVDTRSGSIKVDGKEADLGPTEYHFALLLICHLMGERRSEGCPQLLPEANPVSIIGQEGMVLFSENRLENLIPVLEGLDSVAGGESAVLAAFYGLALLDCKPEAARRQLADSARLLQAENDPRAELVVLSFLVFYHVVFDGDTRRAQRYLDRAETLNKAVFDRLTVYSRIAVAQNLAAGRLLLLNDFAGANEHLGIAEALAEDRGLVNQVVLNRLVAIYEAYFRGEHDAMSDGLDECFRFINHPQVSRLHKTMLRVLQLNYFILTGDFRNVQLLEEGMREELQRSLASGNIASGQLLLGRLEKLLFDGRFEEALQLASEGLQRQEIVANDLLRPLLNGFRALGAAMCGNREAAREALQECRSDSGEKTFLRARAMLYCARACAKIGEAKTASGILRELAPEVEGRGWHNLQLQLRAQQLLLADDGDPDEGGVDSLFAAMQERHIWYLPSLAGEDYQLLFRLADRNASAKRFARDLLRKRLQVGVDDSGETYPILNISTLGGLKMSFGEKTVARTEEFSRTQRECLALLAAVPENRVDQEEVQLAFWPDSSPEKARSTLDTMLSRLRRTLRERLQPQPVKRYLKMQKGVLSLEGVAVDATEVASGIARAREHVRRREFWLADSAYAKSLSRWHGQFMPGSCNVDQSAGFARQLQQMCLEASLEWSVILNESGLARRAVEVLEHALSMDRGNESIMKGLYRSQMRNGNIAMAHQLLQQFEKTLRAEGYSPSEAARIVTSFKTADT